MDTDSKNIINLDLKREGKNLIIDSEIRFKITKLGIDLYQYYATGQEKYVYGVFSSFSSKTNQNKKEKHVKSNIISNTSTLKEKSSCFKKRESIVGCIFFSL